MKNKKERHRKIYIPSWANEIFLKFSYKGIPLKIYYPCLKHEVAIAITVTNGGTKP